MPVALAAHHAIWMNRQITGAAAPGQPSAFEKAQFPAPGDRLAP
jgi:hypothetical protein